MARQLALGLLAANILLGCAPASPRPVVEMALPVAPLPVATVTVPPVVDPPRSCAAGDMVRCVEEGVAHEHGEGRLLDLERAAEFYKRACEGGAWMGCVRLGLALKQGSGVAKHRARAFGLFRKACAGGEKEGCAELGAWAEAASAPGGAVLLGAAERRAIARALCASEPVASGARLKCDCPPYTDFPDEGQLAKLFELGQLFPGHFSGPGRDEVVVQTSGCASGAGSAQTYGSKAVVRRTTQGWQRVFYGGPALGSCTAIRSVQGRSRLACLRVSGHQGTYPTELMLVEIDERRGEVHVDTDVFFEFDAHEVSLHRNMGATGPLPVARLSRHALLGKGGYEAGREEALGYEVVVRSWVDCVGGPKGCPGVDTSPVETRLLFGFDGWSFVLAPGSAAAGKRLRERLSPEP